MPDDFDPEAEYKRALFRKLDPRVAQTIFAKPKDSRKPDDPPARPRKMLAYIRWFCFGLGAVVVMAAIVALATPSMRPHFLSLLDRSWIAFIASQGATTLGWVSSAIVVPILTVGLAVIFILQHRGRDAMLSHWREDAIITLRVIFFVVLFYYGPLFIWKGLVRTVYDDHQSLTHANTKLKSDNNSLAAERDRYKKQAESIPALEQQIKDLQAGKQTSEEPVRLQILYEKSRLDGRTISVPQNPGNSPPIQLSDFNITNFGSHAIGPITLRLYFSTPAFTCRPAFLLRGSRPPAMNLITRQSSMVLLTLRSTLILKRHGIGLGLLVKREGFQIRM